jgi:hypothetical protein
MNANAKPPAIPLRQIKNCLTNRQRSPTRPFKLAAFLGSPTL